jgi:hypothetical protein
MPWLAEAGAPPIKSIGQQFAQAFANPAAPCTTPGPDTHKHTCGWAVKYDAAPAAYEAACSLRKPTKVMPAC